MNLKDGSVFDPGLEAAAEAIYAELGDTIYGDAFDRIPWDRLPFLTQQRFCKAALAARNVSEVVW
ncbi:hypothetical protein [Nocardia flavorosea]|uniref:Uncharacterized protein n=1 Tax=Nocardia flavorosea TaxID=53429 RepID=A0A846YNQ9_9NOCA|nr:hypothetical protein [Nocardia flavorosea]NKY60413.1 hypothetical protein [Nocardia flavorosea]